MRLFKRKSSMEQIERDTRLHNYAADRFREALGKSGSRSEMFADLSSKSTSTSKSVRSQFLHAMDEAYTEEERLNVIELYRKKLMFGRGRSAATASRIILGWLKKSSDDGELVSLSADDIIEEEEF